MTLCIGIRVFYPSKARSIVNGLNSKRFLSSFVVRRPKHPNALQMSVPPLKQSIEKYLAYIRPVVSSKQYEETHKIASTYLNSAKVSDLQDLLIKRSQMEDNWLFDWWLNSYLDYRAPVVINSNFALRLQTLECDSDKRWLNHATSIIQGILEYKGNLESYALPTEYFADGDPMCMQQYYNILGNCRIPGTDRDRMLCRRGGLYTSQIVGHICVFYRNRPFILEFRDRVTNESLPASMIYSQLAHIVATARELPPGLPIGLLTSLPRDEWSRIHSVLRQNVLNSNTLSAIEQSLFILCLDDDANLPPPDSKAKQSDGTALLLDRRETTSAINSMHGQLFNSGNRWFDKSIQFIISRDGSMGANCEHTAADAGSMLPLVSEVYDILDRSEEIPLERLPIYAQPHELEWLLPDSIEKELESASDALKTLIDSVEVEYGHFQAFGSAAIKQVKSSPDAFVQVAMQLAYARLHPDRLPPPTYETGSLRRYYLGRTDTIRSCSQDSVLFTQSMRNKDSCADERAKLLRGALQSHQDYTKQLMRGQAFDRHLLGLRLLASSLYDPNNTEENEVFLLFNDPSYAEAHRFRLSTSQVPSQNDVATLFGPAVSDGYGVCYNIHPNSVQITASSFQTCGDSRPPVEFLTALSHALQDMKKLLDAPNT